MVVEAVPCSGCFTIYMGAQFSIVELDNVWYILQVVRVSVQALSYKKQECGASH